MTGLEKIIEHIKQDSIEESNRIIAEAQAEIDEIAKAASEERNRLAHGLEERSSSERDLIKSRGDSAAALTGRKMLLTAKQQIIDETLEAAKLHLLNLPDAEYFSYLERLIKKFSLGQDGEILFSAKDLKRIPAGFDTVLKQNSLKLSNETRNIEGGFVLLYGDIEENCSVEALFLAGREALQDKIKDLLFTE